MSKTCWASLLPILLAMSVPAGATAASNRKLAFYMVSERLPYERIAWWTDLNGLRLAEPPFIEIGDIETYDWSTHTLVVTPDCGKRLAREFRLTPPSPIITCPFVVVADSVRIYMGVLNSIASSWATSDVPVVTIPLGDDSARSMLIQKAGRGYDERTDPRIRDALKQAGVLVGE